MNRLAIGAIATVLAAGGTGAWWMFSGKTAPAAEATIAGPAVPETAAEGGVLDGAGAVSSTTDPKPVVAVATEAPAAAPTAPSIEADDLIAIERGYCFGPCPVYTATAYGDDRVVFEGKKFVAMNGRVEKKLDAGGFARLVDIVRRHGIMSMDTNWPDEKGLNCPEPPTDLPTVTVSVDAAEITRTIKFYEGCAGTPGADRVKSMVADLDKSLALDAWIGSREAYYGKRNKP